MAQTKWTMRDFRGRNPTWTAGNGNKVVVASAMMLDSDAMMLNGVDAEFLVIEYHNEWNQGSGDWLDPVREMYAEISSPESAEKLRNDKEYLYITKMIAWGEGDMMRWALF